MTDILAQRGQTGTDRGTPTCAEFLPSARSHLLHRRQPRTVFRPAPSTGRATSHRAMENLTRKRFGNSRASGAVNSDPTE